ncbi:MAG TPA: hypothetical protein DDW52_27255 [Planctomycetaceae bacterium]|nr:hypothetical protein [Planctomycetaceae bacterium]
MASFLPTLLGTEKDAESESNGLLLVSDVDFGDAPDNLGKQLAPQIRAGDLDTVWLSVPGFVHVGVAISHILANSTQNTSNAPPSFLCH